MVQCSIKMPSVFVVDSNARPPPLPPKPGRRQRRDVVQTLLVIFVAIALCGMALEACLIYHLYASKENSSPSTDPQTAKRKQDKEHATPSKQDLSGVMKPPKPMAYLTTGQIESNKGTLLWDKSQESILHHVKHKANEGKLIIEKEGYYAVYSKIHFKQEDNTFFTHSVLQKTDRYPKEILLLQSTWSHHKTGPESTDNSYLSGVFHLFKGDAVFVSIKNCKLVLSNSAENYFGVFMV